MSSHHDHPHDHHHHDNHEHDHGQDHRHEQTSQELSFEEKLVKIFDHWIKHNESHAQTYIDWGEKAKAHGFEDIATLLDDIAGLSKQLTEKLQDGLSKAPKK